MNPAPPVPDQANPRALPQPLTLILGLLALIGFATFAGSVLLGTEATKATAWRAFHVNYLYLGALAQGGLVLACAFVIIGANWPGPVRRIAEGLAAWVPATFILGAISVFGWEYLFGGDHGWLHGHGNPKKASWLNMWRVAGMDLAIFGLLAMLTITFLKASLRPALHSAAQQGGRFASWTEGWKGDEAEREESERKLRVLAPIICLVFAFGWSFVAFDQVMSLSEAWYSNLFGAYFAWGGFLSAVCATALIAVLLRNSPGMQGHITPGRMHDLGKLIFAFSIFWMYLFFSQYLVIWYGNLPEETFFLKERLGSQFMMRPLDSAHELTTALLAERLAEPYAKLTLAVWACCWIIPFWVLLGQRPKRTPAILGSVSAVVLLGFWLERNVLIWPSLLPHDSTSWLGPIQLLIALGFISAFVLVFLYYSRVFPSLAVPEES